MARKKKLKKRLRISGNLNNKKCLFCDSENNLTIHHVIPRSLGGSNEQSNLVLLCAECHRKLHQVLLDPIVQHLRK